MAARFEMVHGFVLAAALTCVVVGCKDEEPIALPGPTVVLETEVLDAQQIEAGVAEATAIIGFRDASDSAANLAGIGVLPPSVLGETAIYQVTAGKKTSIEYDIDRDDVLETLSVFIPTGRSAYLAWQEEGHCRLTWHEGATAWYIDVVCGEDGGLVCTYDDAVVCTLCDAEYCAPCTVEGRNVACEEIVPPEPDVGLDTEPDVIDDEVVDDVGDDPSSDVPSEDTTPPEDTTSGDSTLPEDTTPPEDTTQPSGQCDPTCMESSGAVCCTTCGCAPSDCRPTCGRSGYSWDCEVECCFNYDILECDES